MQSRFHRSFFSLLAVAGSCLFQSAAAQELLPTEPPEVIFTSPRGVQVLNGGYGSGMAKHPTDAGVYYLLTDRGPNFNGAEPGSKVFPVPEYVPQIGVFRAVDGLLVRESVIEIKAPSGEPISGLPNPVGLGGTGETAIDLAGNPLELDPQGLDPEGLVAMPDGSFWLSDEYGPHILHLSAEGQTIERINPFGSGEGGRRLPRVFASRRANRGMEGLTVTPDGSTLVGIMQSAMYNPFDDRTAIRTTSRATRIVLFNIASGETQQFVYLQEAPNLSNSEIRAISNTEFIVLERDGRFPGNEAAPAVYKRFYRIDLTGATDISDPEDGELGLMFDVAGTTKTIEQMSVLEILDAGIVPVSKELYVDLLVELPGSYGHDKPEGFSILEDGRLAIINDDDFGITTDGMGGILPKNLPQTGAVDRNILYTVSPTVVAPVEGFRLQILHASDNESSFQDPNTLEPKVLNYGAVIEGLNELATREGIGTVYLTAGDHTLPGPFYQASAQVESLGARGLADIGFFNAMGLTANGIGNHEFDGGIDDFAVMLASADYPFLAVNLDFSQVQLGEGSPEIAIGVDGASVTENASKVAKSAWVEVNGERIGLIGRAPADFFNVIDDPDVNLPGLDFVGGRNPEDNQPLESAIPQVLEQVDLLKAQGINKIILLDHAQDFTGDPLSASLLRDIDVIVAAGSTGFMARPEPQGPFNLLRPEDSPAADYPTLRQDSEGNPVFVVNSDQIYRYVGHLIVSFDDAGLITHVDDRSGPIATTAEGVAALSTELLVPTLQPNERSSELFTALVNTPLIQDQFTVVGTTSHPLNGARADVRTRDTNLGRIAADSTLWWAQRYVREQGLGIDVDIALKNGGGIRDTILGPNVTKLTIGSALAFNNSLAIIELTGSELLAAMENAVSRFPARDGRFPHLAGVEVEFDPRRPGVSDALTLEATSRIFSLVVERANGQRVTLVEEFQVIGDLSQTFTLASNSFLLSGGDGYRAFEAVDADPNRTTLRPETGEQAILAEYIQSVLGGSVSVTDAVEPRVRVFSELGQFASVGTNIFDESAAEIVVFDPFSQRLFVSNAFINGIDVMDASNPEAPSYEFSVGDLGGNVNSVAVSNGIVAVAVANDNGVDNGWVVFLDALLGTELNRLEVGVLPDMVTFSPDGTKVLTANEGEPNDAYTVDPLGSVSIIDVGTGSFVDIVTMGQDRVTTLDFTPYNFFADVLRAVGVRIYGQLNNPKTGEFLRASTLAEDLEPEYITVTPDSQLAYVAMQENNAMAVVDLNSMELVDLFPLGFKDHSIEGQGFDASNRDGAINIQNWPTLGMYQPDAIASYETLGRTYIVSANEGDSRDYDGYSEETRVADLVLDPEAYPDAATLQLDENLGRLKTTTANGDVDGDGDFDQIYSYGSRSFSIWDEFGNLVFDSGDDFERITGERLGGNFNATNDENGSFDDRSDDKGPEPEALAIGTIDDRIYAFIGLERVGGIMMYDITSPHSASFVEYLNLRDFGLADATQVNDLGPEGLAFIPADSSPNGQPLLVVANEVSGDTTIHVIRVPAPESFMLQVLHSSDNESAFQEPNTLEPTILNYGAVLNGLQSLAAKEEIASIYVTAGDHTLPGPFYEASTEISGLGANGLADIAFYNAMGLTANGIGNHEFDGGIDDFAHLLNAADYPFLAVNLDFSQVALAEGTPAIQIGQDGASVAANAGKVARSAWVEVGGERIGLIGRAPADFFNVIEDPATRLPGLDFVGGREPENNQPLVSAVDLVLEQVAILEAQGINKIILLDHAQDFTADPLSAERLRGIDIIVSAGATGFMAQAEANGPFNLLRPEDSPSADYPTVRTDSEGFDVLVVNSDQNYRYVGQLIVSFDAAGHITLVDDRSGPVASTPEAIVALESELTGRISAPEVAPTDDVVALFSALRDTDLIIDQFQYVGETTAELVGLRAEVRTRETNLGRLAADSTLWFAQRELDALETGLQVDIALKNGGGIRDTILGPSITRLPVNTALRFNNRLSIAELTAAEVIATFENAVSRFPAADGRFPQVAGLFLEFDPERPGIEAAATLDAPSRVKNLTVFRSNGVVDVLVSEYEAQGDLSRTFVLATNSFLMTGGDGYAALRAVNDDPERVVFSTEIGEQQILVDYITEALGGLVDLPEPLDAARISRFEIIDGLLLGASVADGAVSYIFWLTEGASFVLEAREAIGQGEWTALAEGADFEMAVSENGDGSVNLTVTLPTSGSQRYVRLIVTE